MKNKLIKPKQSVCLKAEGSSEKCMCLFVSLSCAHADVHQPIISFCSGNVCKCGKEGEDINLFRVYQMHYTVVSSSFCCDASIFLKSHMTKRSYVEKF